MQGRKATKALQRAAVWRTKFRAISFPFLCSTTGETGPETLFLTFVDPQYSVMCQWDKQQEKKKEPNRTKDARLHNRSGSAVMEADGLHLFLKMLSHPIIMLDRMTTIGNAGLRS